MMKIYCLIPSLLFLAMTLQVSAEENQDLPTTEQFQSLLTTCAAGASIQIDGELRGSITEVYSGAKSKTEGRNFKFITLAEFLKVLPPEDRLAGLKLYNNCILEILNGKKAADIKKIPEIYELPKTLITYGKPLHIKARTIIANSSEIRAFPSGTRASDGSVGKAGSNGGNGANGSSGPGGHGTGGTAGTSGTNGLNASEIRIEADQLIGKLRIINNGAVGGNGGRGGNGGHGGAGGKGRNSVNGIIDCSSGPGNGGSGGNAGNGGDGGRGGNGGDGGSVIIDIQKVEPSSSLVIASKGASGGAAGPIGSAGNYGAGGPMGNTGGRCDSGGRGPGANGASANNGRTSGTGQAGTDGQIEISIANKISVVSSTYSREF